MSSIAGRVGIYILVIICVGASEWVCIFGLYRYRTCMHVLVGAIAVLYTDQYVYYP